MSYKLPSPSFKPQIINHSNDIIHYDCIFSGDLDYGFTNQLISLTILWMISEIHNCSLICPRFRLDMNKDIMISVKNIFPQVSCHEEYNSKLRIFHAPKYGNINSINVKGIHIKNVYFFQKYFNKWIYKTKQITSRPKGMTKYDVELDEIFRYKLNKLINPHILQGENNKCRCIHLRVESDYKSRCPPTKFILSKIEQIKTKLLIISGDISFYSNLIKLPYKWFKPNTYRELAALESLRECVKCNSFLGFAGSSLSVLIDMIMQKNKKDSELMNC
jgi:hypothetical protein